MTAHIGPTAPFAVDSNAGHWFAEHGVEAFKFNSMTFALAISR